jgi:hypothetical protein
MRVNKGKGCGAHQRTNCVICKKKALDRNWRMRRKGTWTVTFTAGTLRSVHTMTGTQREVKAWAERELEYFAAPGYLKKKFHLREVKQISPASDGTDLTT